MNKKIELINQQIKTLEKSIQNKEKQREKKKPSDVSLLDREIRRSKRYLQNLQEAANILEMDEEANEKSIDEMTKARMAEYKAYEDAVAAGVDFNDCDNPMVISASRLWATNELVDLLVDAVNWNKEHVQRFPEMEYFTKTLNTAIADRKKRITQAKIKVDEAEAEQRKTEKSLQDAKKEGNLESIIAFTDQLETDARVVIYYKDLLRNEEKKSALSVGDSMAEWEKVCEVYGYEWRNRLYAVLLAAQIYHDNLQQLEKLNNDLWLVRKNLQDLGNRNGDSNNITKCQKITADIPEIEKVMQRDEEDRLMRAVFFQRGEML